MKKLHKVLAVGLLVFGQGLIAMDQDRAQQAQANFDNQISSLCMDAARNNAPVTIELTAEQEPFMTSVMWIALSVMQNAPDDLVAVSDRHGIALFVPSMSRSFQTNRMSLTIAPVYHTQFNDDGVIRFTPAHRSAE